MGRVIPFAIADAARRGLGQRLREVREARRLTLGELAETSGIAPRRLDYAERGQVRLEARELHALLDALDLPLGLLVNADADLTQLRPF